MKRNRKNFMKSLPQYRHYIAFYSLNTYNNIVPKKSHNIMVHIYII